MARSEAAGMLRSLSYPTIERLMVGYTINYDRVSAACLATGEPMPLPNEVVDTSFKAQIAQVHDRPDSLTTDLTIPPEVFVVTANSAVPVADAVRGFYDGLGVERPNITYVQADRNSSENYYGGLRHSLPKKEVERLRSLLNGAAHVCLIDEFVWSGNTVGYASQLLKAAGAKAVSVVRGYWYASVQGHIDLNKVSSPVHREFMHHVGVLSCRGT